jgi:mRNA interferase MazF
MLANGTVGSAQLAAGSVTTRSLADGAVSLGKLTTALAGLLSTTFTNPTPASSDLFGVAVAPVGTDKLLVVSIPFLDHERTLCLVVPHTTSLIGTRFEVAVEHPALRVGALDVQQTAVVQAVKFVRRIGALKAEQMRTVEHALAQVLGLKLAGEV